MKSNYHISIISAALAIILLAGCSGTSLDKPAHLEKLKAEQATLTKQIANLEKEILADYPYLEIDDIKACLEYASKQVDHAVVMVS